MSSLIVASVLRNKKLVFSYWTWQPCTNNYSEWPVDQAAGIRKGGGPEKGREMAKARVLGDATQVLVPATLSWSGKP